MLAAYLIKLIATEVATEVTAVAMEVPTEVATEVAICRSRGSYMEVAIVHIEVATTRGGYMQR